jgi:hypothetical protein
MRFRATLFGLLIVGLPAVAAAQQYTPYGAPRSPTVIRQAGLWEDYMHVPDGHCGCPMPVRCNDYHHCCNTCGIRPVCWLKRFGRMLDCLLPCNLCHGGLHGCGGCCGHGYAAHYGGYSPGCANCDAPALTDPFQDDPLPPKPMPEAGHDVHFEPMRTLPAPIASDPRPSSQARATAPRPSVQPIQSQPAIAARPGVMSQMVEKSVLRRTSLEEETGEPAAIAVMVEEARPIQSRAKSAPAAGSDSYWAGVPVNPLRQSR